MKTKRCFLAVPLPPLQVYYDEVTRLKQLAKVSVVDPDLYHITLHFFGNISDEEIESICENLDDLEFNRFVITLRRPKILPSNPSKARVLYLDADSPDLVEMARLIRQQLNLSGKPFLPHFTIGRVKGGDRRAVASSFTELNFEPVDIEIDRIELIHSLLTPNGPVYSPIFVKKLV